MGKSGQKKAQRNEPFYKNFRKKVAPNQYLENKLIQFEKLDDSSRQLWADFLKYTSDEREKVLEDIQYCLMEHSVEDYQQDSFSRIIGSKFSLEPFSSKGSYLTPPGGRFNFGQSISYQTYFSALYIANNFDVAYQEKYGCSENFESSDGLTSLDLSLSKPDSFTHQRVKFNLERVIDLRDDDALSAFFDVIKHIKMPKLYADQAKRLGVSMAIISDCEHLRLSLFDPHYEQWDYWIDQPSPSQWFGHYVRLAGIQGVIYPSVRSEDGTNVAIFLDQFESSGSFVELVDESDFVPTGNKRVDASNYQLFT